MAVISELETVHRTTNRWVKSQAVSPHRAVGYQTTERLTVASLQPLQIFKNRIVNIDCGAHDQYHTAINDPSSQMFVGSSAARAADFSR